MAFRILRPSSISCCFRGQFANKNACHCEVRSIIVDDPFEHSLPETGSLQSVSVSDGEVKQRWVLGDSKETQSYRRWREEQNSVISQTLKKMNISRYHVSSAFPLDEQLQSMQRERV